MKIMTGKTGTPHVTSQQFRQLVEGTVGQDSYILSSGENLEPELQTNNLLKIRSGMMSHHGNLSVVELGTYDEVTIQNGTQGMQRIDLVVNRYTRNEETGIEKNEWVVIMGTPAASDPVAPAYTEGNLQEGDLVDDCPVFEVHLDGINVTEVVKLLDVTPDIPTLNASLSELKVYETDNNGGWTVVKHKNKWTELHITAMIPRASTETYSLALNFPDGIRLRNAQTFITPARNGWNVANYYHNNDSQDSMTVPIDHTNLVFSAKTAQSLTYYFEVIVCGFET